MMIEMMNEVPPSPLIDGQIIFGLERLVDMTIAKKVPQQVAYGTAIRIRFCNNVIDGCTGRVALTHPPWWSSAQYDLYLTQVGRTSLTPTLSWLVGRGCSTCGGNL